MGKPHAAKKQAKLVETLHHPDPRGLDSASAAHLSESGFVTFRVYGLLSLWLLYSILYGTIGTGTIICYIIL